MIHIASFFTGLATAWITILLLQLRKVLRDPSLNAWALGMSALTGGYLLQAFRQFSLQQLPGTGLSFWIFISGILSMVALLMIVWGTLRYFTKNPVLGTVIPSLYAIGAVIFTYALLGSGATNVSWIAFFTFFGLVPLSALLALLFYLLYVNAPYLPCPFDGAPKNPGLGIISLGWVFFTINSAFLYFAYDTDLMGLYLALRLLIFFFILLGFSKVLKKSHEIRTFHMEVAT